MRKLLAVTALAVALPLGGLATATAAPLHHAPVANGQRNPGGGGGSKPKPPVCVVYSPFGCLIWSS